MILASREGGLHIAIVDGGTDDAGAAVIAAWAVYRPGFTGSTRNMPGRPREEWEKRLAYRYENPAVELHNVFSLALRKGEHWAVLINGPTGAVTERRDVQVAVIFN